MGNIRGLFLRWFYKLWQADLEKEIFKLEKAKLDEDVAAWKDVLSLKKELIKLREKLKSSKSKLFLKE